MRINEHKSFKRFFNEIKAWFTRLKFGTSRLKAMHINCKFTHSYQFAAALRESIFNNDYTGILTVSVIKKLTKPQTESLLHIYIRQFIIDDVDNSIRDVGSEQELVDFLQNLLNVYIVSFQEADENYPRQNEYDDERDYACYLFTIIKNHILTFLTNEIFYILYGDRMFLKEFNKKIALEIAELKVSDYPKILSKDGVLKRPDNIPVWVQKAVKFRDKGLCVLCGNDVSGFINPQSIIHFDHIVALDNSGSNDVTNFQCTCGGCNSKKSASNASSDIYIPYY